VQTLNAAEFALRLAVGLGCGALIGVERQWRARMAGLRTNALVAAGATVFVLYSDAPRAELLPELGLRAAAGE
jgi:putative Mg2+ transporter-C (MgtC) family protein